MPSTLPPIIVVDEEEYAREEAAAAEAGVNLSGLRKPAAFDYDSAQYPFREAVLMCLDMPVTGNGADDNAALEALRTHNEMSAADRAWQKNIRLHAHIAVRGDRGRAGVRVVEGLSQAVGLLLPSRHVSRPSERPDIRIVCR